MQLRELEQRARDTAVISAERLQQMLPEAKTKQLAATTSREEAIRALCKAAGVVAEADKPEESPRTAVKKMLAAEETSLAAGVIASGGVLKASGAAPDS